MLSLVSGESGIKKLSITSGDGACILAEFEEWWRIFEGEHLGDDFPKTAEMPKVAATAIFSSSSSMLSSSSLKK